MPAAFSAVVMEVGTALPRILPTLPPEAPVAEWRVLRPIGRGGAATVYEAQHTRTGRRVAMKVVDIDLRRRTDLRVRFEREIRALAAIEDPHVPQVIDFGELENGAPYVVLERLEGETLEQRLDRAPMSIRECVWLAQELLIAVEAVHAHGIVHRDIKPANIFLHRTEDGRETVKLLDFGVCYPLREAACPPRLTQDGGLVGTAPYIAPELLLGDTPDPRADLYSVGAVLYECVTGIPPHTGGTWNEIVLRVLEEEPVPIRRLRTRCPIGLERFVRIALERTPERRFESAHEMATRLADVIAGGVPVRRDECLYCIRSSPPDAPNTKPARKWPMLAALAALAALCMVLILTL